MLLLHKGLREQVELKIVSIQAWVKLVYMHVILAYNRHKQIIDLIMD